MLVFGPVVWEPRPERLWRGKSHVNRQRVPAGVRSRKTLISSEMGGRPEWPGTSVSGVENINVH